MKEYKDRKAHRVQPVPQVILVIQDIRDTRDTQVILGILDIQDTQDTQVIRVILVIQDTQDTQVILDILAIQVPLGKQDIKVHKDLWVLLVQQDDIGVTGPTGPQGAVKFNGRGHLIFTSNISQYSGNCGNTTTNNGSSNPIMEKNIEYWLYPQTGGTTPIVSFENYNSAIPSNQRMIRSRYWKSQPSGLPIRGTGTAQTLNIVGGRAGTTGVSPNLAYPPIATIPFKEFYIGPVDLKYTPKDLSSNCNYSINQSESTMNILYLAAPQDQSNNQLIQRYKVKIYKYCGQVGKNLGPTGSQGPVTDISFTIGVSGVFAYLTPTASNWNTVDAAALYTEIDNLKTSGNFSYVSCGCTGPTTGLTGGCDPSGNAISVSITPLDQDSTPQWNNGDQSGQGHAGYSGNISLTIPFYYKELFTN